MTFPGNGVSIRDAMLPIGDGLDLFAAMREIGVRSVELEVKPDLSCPLAAVGNGFGSVANEPAIAKLRQVFAQEQVRISALLLATDFSSASAGDHVRWAIDATKAARSLGIPVVRIDPLALDRSLPAETVRKRVTRALAAVLEATEMVDLGIENHGPIANDPAFLDALFAELPDPRIGLTLDTGNFYWYGFALDELYELIQRFAPRANHTHLKNINYPPHLASQRRPVGIDYGKYCCSLDEGNIDLGRVIRILREAGYQRDVCVENESLSKKPVAERLDRLKRDVAAVGRALAG